MSEQTVGDCGPSKMYHLRNKLKAVSSKFKEFKPEYLVLLLALLLRAPLKFANSDSRIYGLFLRYFINNLRMPYPDHPPLLFAIIGSITSFFQFIRSISSLLVILAFLVTLSISLYLFRDKNYSMRLLTAVLIFYIFVTGLFGSFYEIALLPNLLAGLFAVHILFQFADYLYDRKIAVTSAILLACSWWHIVYSRVLLIDGFAAAMILWSVYHYVRLIKGDGSFFWTTAALTIAFYSKYYALIIMPILGLYILIWCEGWKKKIRLLLPEILGGIAVLPWLLMTKFYLADHFASTHYLLSSLPSILAFFRSYWILLTPFVFFLVLISLQRYKEIGPLPYLIFGVPLVFYIYMTYFELSSHPLINQSNYMLFTLPFLIFMAAHAWKAYIGQLFTNERVVLVILALLVSVPFLIVPQISLEYDKGYEAYRGNFNSVNPRKSTSISHKIPKIHFVYSFRPKLVFLNRIKPWNYHFRWKHPRKILILSSEEQKIQLDFLVRKLREDPNVLVIDDGVTRHNYTIRGRERIKLLTKVKEGFNSLKLVQKSNKTRFPTNFILRR